MMKHLIASICFLMPLHASAQEKRPVTPDDLMGLSTVIDAKISPNGNSVVYALSTPSLQRNQHEVSLHFVSTGTIVGVRSHSKIKLTSRILNTPLPAPRLRWHPEGKRISFLGLKNDKPQVFTFDFLSMTDQPITDAPEGVSNYEWSPDGMQVACLTSEPMSNEEQMQRKNQSFVTHADAPSRPTRLALKQADGTWKMLTPPQHYVEGFSWSPDGKEIAYAAAPTSGFTAQYQTKIYAVPVGGGEPRVIVDRTGMNSTPRFSPDGKSIAFTSSNGVISLMAPRGLNVVPAAGGAIKSFALQDAWVSDVTWAADSKSVFLLTFDGTFGRQANMFEQAVVRVWTESGKAERVDEGPAANFSLSISRDGSRIAYRKVTPRSMGDITVLSLQDFKAETITEVNPQLQKLTLGELKPIKWSSFDKMEIWGLLLTPPGYKAATRVPTLVYCHGGPNGGVTYGLYPQFMHVPAQVDYYPVEAFASAGFAVFFPMPRGGAGYGEAGQRSIVNDWGGADYKDIMAGVDFLVAQGIADPDRLGVMGASYGGYMTNWIVTQTSRFKAASAGASIADLADQYYLSDGGEVMAEYFKKPWEAPESYKSHSPLTFVANVTTPLLIQQGERDNRVPAANAWKFYRALKQQGKTVELDIHPRSSHVFYEPMQEYMAQKRNLEWFTKWIKVP